MGVSTGINHQEIARTSKLVSHLCNMPVQPNKAIVGSNAFSHSSGIHQDGMLKASNTYEIMTPESVGISKTKLNLTSRSGRHVIKHRMGTLGYNETDFDIEALYEDFLKLADKKGQVFDDDLEALLFNIQQQDSQEHYQILDINVQSGSGEFATAGVKLSVGEEVQTQSATGNGPVDALYQAIKKAVDEDIEVADYKISNKGAGENGLGVANLVVKWQERNFHGYGIATDVIEASGQAFVSALNAIQRAKHIAALREERKTNK